MGNHGNMDCIRPSEPCLSSDCALCNPNWLHAAEDAHGQRMPCMRAAGGSGKQVLPWLWRKSQGEDLSMNTTISPLEFLITNVICVAAGALAVLAIQCAGKAVYCAGQRNAEHTSANRD